MPIINRQKHQILPIANRNVYKQDLGALWENLVFLQIKKKKVSYFLEKEREVDFIVELSPRHCLALEAKLKEQITPEEMKALKDAPGKEKILVSTLADLQKIQQLMKK